MPLRSQFESLSYDSVLAYRAKTYTASNLVVTASGIPATNLRVLLEAYLHELPKGAGRVLHSSPYIGGDVRMKADLDGKTVIGLGFPLPENDSSALLLKDMVLSKLNSVCGVYHPYSSGGLLGFVIEGSNPQEASAGLEKLISEIKQLAVFSSASTVEALRKHISLELISAYESSAFTTAAIRAAAAGKVNPPNSVGVLDIPMSAVAQSAKTLLNATPAYVVYGRTAGTPNFAAVSKMLK